MIRGGEGGGEILEEAGTFSGQALLLSYPYPRGGGPVKEAGTHSPPCPQYLPNIKPHAMHQVVKGSPLLAEEVYVTHSLSQEQGVPGSRQSCCLMLVQLLLLLQDAAWVLAEQAS